MNAGFGSWLFDMSLGASALGGMLGMASGVFIALAATTFVAALLYAISGFGFAVLAAPLLFSCLSNPTPAIQFVIVSTVLSIGVVLGLLRENRAVAGVIGTDIADSRGCIRGCIERSAIAFSFAGGSP
jgi:hypothetical protein